MSYMAANLTLKGVGDVTRRLSQRITPDELDELFGDDADSFSLLVVAEAVLPRVPLGIVTWLRQPKNSAEWAESLIENEGLHQIAWWTRKVMAGDESEAARQARETLQAIRDRLAEARQVAGMHAKPRSHSAPEARALERLRLAHREEYDLMAERLRRRHSLPFEKPTTVVVKELLAMSDGAFRNLVANDVRNEQRVNDLADPLVTSRWHDALVDLGKVALEALGLPTTKIDRTADEARFAIPDAWLPEGPLLRHDISAWTARLTFLTHVRVRLMERARLRQAAKREVTEKVFEPTEEHLRRTYFAEYARYRIEEQAEAKVSPPPLRTEKLNEERRELQGLGWQAEVVSEGRRRWLDARRGAQRLVVAISRQSSGKWKAPSFFAHIKVTDTWHRVPSFGVLRQIAEAEPCVYDSKVEGIKPRYVITDTEQLLRIVPPSRDGAFSAQAAEAS